MNISPVQNNNSQSFGMAFHLKGNGAKKLATVIEETNSIPQQKHIMNEILGVIKDLKSKVTYDGATVSIEPPGGYRIADLTDLKLENKSSRAIATSYERPYSGTTPDPKVVSFVVYDGYGPIRYDIQYPNDVNISQFKESDPLLQKLLNAREVAKDLDKKAAQKAYEDSVNAAKQARIDERTKELQDLFG